MKLFRWGSRKRAETGPGGKLPQMALPERFRASVLDSTKLIASMPFRFGEVGSHFVAFDSEFVLIDVRESTLGLVTKCLYRAEGYAAEEDFIEGWARQYPDLGYRPEQVVYVHLFTKAGP